MFHLFQVTGIFPTLLVTFRCVSYLYCSCVFWVTFGVWLCLLLILFLCILGDVCCVVVCYLYCSCVFWVMCGVWLCLLLILFLCFLGKENGSEYNGRSCGVQESFVEDAVAAEVFVRTWDATERWCTEQVATFPTIPAYCCDDRLVP